MEVNITNQIIITIPEQTELKLTKVDENFCNTKDITDESGVYLLFDENKILLYVGITKTLRNRLCGHLNNNSSRYDFSKNVREPMRDLSYITPLPYGIVKYMYFIKTDDNLQKRVIEDILFYAYKPLFNNSHPQDALKKYKEILGDLFIK